MNAALIDSLHFPPVSVSMPSIVRRCYFRGMGPEYTVARDGQLACMITSAPMMIEQASGTNLITIAFVDVNGMFAPLIRHYVLVSQGGNMYPLPQEVTVMQDIYNHLSDQLNGSMWRCASITAMATRQLTSGLIDRMVKTVEFPANAWTNIPQKKSRRNHTDVTARLYQPR